MHKRVFRTRIRIVNIPAEMFIDAIYFLDEAKKLEEIPENYLLRGRYLRATIILSFFSLEAYMNSFILGHSRKFPVKGLPEKIIRSRKLSFENKFDMIVPFITGKLAPKRKGKIWKDFEDIKSIRNRLAHYKGGIGIYDPKNPIGVNIRNAEKGIEMVKQMVKYLNDLAGSKAPPWIDHPEAYFKHILMQK